jgi:hypothetical protein
MMQFATYNGKYLLAAETAEPLTLKVSATATKLIAPPICLKIHTKKKIL